MGAVIHLLHRQPPRDDDAENRLRVAFGAAAPPELMRAFGERFGVELLETYGSTELGPASAPPARRRPSGDHGPPVRAPAPRDPRRRRPCRRGRCRRRDRRTAGRAGRALPRLLQTGPRPPSTRSATSGSTPADRGRLEHDGRLVFLDRISDSLRRRGENISSFEVERAVQAPPIGARGRGLRRRLGADRGRGDGRRDPRRGRDDRPGGAACAFCVETMPRFAVPRYLRVVDTLPKTPSQRIQKFLLRHEGVTADTPRPRGPRDRGPA